MIIQFHDYEVILSTTKINKWKNVTWFWDCLDTKLLNRSEVRFFYRIVTDPNSATFHTQSVGFWNLFRLQQNNSFCPGILHCFTRITIPWNSKIVTTIVFNTSATRKKNGIHYRFLHFNYDFMTKIQRSERPAKLQKNIQFNYWLFSNSVFTNSPVTVSSFEV